MIGPPKVMPYWSCLLSALWPATSSAGVDARQCDAALQDVVLLAHAVDEDVHRGGGLRAPLQLGASVGLRDEGHARREIGEAQEIARDLRQALHLPRRDVRRNFGSLRLEQAIAGDGDGLDARRVARHHDVDVGGLAHLHRDDLGRLVEAGRYSQGRSSRPCRLKSSCANASPWEGPRPRPPAAVRRSCARPTPCAASVWNACRGPPRRSRARGVRGRARPARRCGRAPW